MQVLKSEIAELAQKLKHANELLTQAVEQCSQVAERICIMQDLPERDTGETLDHLARTAAQRESVLNAVSQRGQGPGLQETLEKAKQLDNEQLRVVDQLRQSPKEKRLTKSALDYYSELERQQRQLLVGEVGKFEAQGLKSLLDEILALAEQQDAAVRDLIRRTADGGS